MLHVWNCFCISDSISNLTYKPKRIFFPAGDERICPKPPAILNGIIRGSTYTIGSFIKYECNDGYSLSGNAYLKCLSNQAWNGPAPRCIGKWGSDSVLLCLLCGSVLWNGSGRFLGTPTALPSPFGVLNGILKSSYSALLMEIETINLKINLK